MQDFFETTYELGVVHMQLKYMYNRRTESDWIIIGFLLLSRNITR